MAGRCRVGGTLKDSERTFSQGLEKDSRNDSERTLFKGLKKDCFKGFLEDSEKTLFKGHRASDKNVLSPPARGRAKPVAMRRSTWVGSEP